jgi:DNA-binding protein YbaB
MHSTTDDFRELVERVEARSRQSAAALADIEESLDCARFTATSDRGQVVATVDGYGHLVSLDFVDVVLTRVPVTELGGQVVAAVNRARAEVGPLFLRMMADRLGPLPAATEEGRR